MTYLIQPMLFVIIFFLFVKIGLMLSFGTAGDLGTILMLGITPMLLSYITLLLVGSPILWLLIRFFKVTIITSIVGTTIITAIALIPFSLSIVENIPDYNAHLFNIFTLMGMLLSVIIYAVTFLQLGTKKI